MSGRAVWGLGAAAVSGLLVLGYCIYFDHQRRSDPNFKKNLREKRKQLAAYGAPVGQSSASSVLGMSLSSSSEGATVEEIPSTLKLDDELE